MIDVEPPPLAARERGAEADLLPALPPQPRTVRDTGLERQLLLALLAKAVFIEGKSTLARQLGALLRGLVAVPYAVALGQGIVQLHDPLLHLAPQQAAGIQQSIERRGSDLRWVLCQRPHALLDDVFLRRLGYKIHVGALDVADYRALLRRQCSQAGIACDAAPSGRAASAPDLGKQFETIA